MILIRMRAFREILSKSKNIVVLTGSGVSAESGVPTFRYRGADGLWKKRKITELATPDTFHSNPSLIWEFYSHKRELATTKVPNGAHTAIAELEKQLQRHKRNLTVITQNTDMLHHRAGSKNVLEMYGNVFKTRCTDCGHVSNNHDIPIVPSLRDRGIHADHSLKYSDPNGHEQAPISLDLLPRCEKCSGLLRPHIVWYGEGMEWDLLSKIDHALRNCDLYIQVGSSSKIYPAANYGPMLVTRGVPVAEFNLGATPATNHFDFHFPGNCGETLPEALSYLTLD